MAPRTTAVGPMLESKSSGDVSLVVYARQPRNVFDDGKVAPAASGEMNPYAVLQVPETATTEQIKAAYKRLAYKFHPDRIRAANPDADPATTDRIFAQINEAYSTLSDQYKRCRYHAMKSMHEEDLSKLQEIKRQQAEQDVELMKEEVAQIVAFETKVNGLIITSAIYGEVHEDINSRAPLAAQKIGEVIDVTTPLQCLVENSRVNIPAGPSKVLLPGFYDAVNGYPKTLIVRYRFASRLHQVSVQDFEALRMPMRAHLLPADCQDVEQPEEPKTPLCRDIPLNIPARVVPSRGTQVSRRKSGLMSPSAAAEWTAPQRARVGPGPFSGVRNPQSALVVRQSEQDAARARRRRHWQVATLATFVAVTAAVVGSRLARDGAHSSGRGSTAAAVAMAISPARSHVGSVPLFW